MSLELSNPYWLLGLLALPLVWRLTRRRAGSGVLFPQVSTLAAAGAAEWFGAVLSQLPRVLRLLALAALLLALAGIEGVILEEEEVLESISVALVLDLSSSMRAQDMGVPRSRLEVAKDQGIRFAEMRRGDRLGLVIFGGRSLIRAPLTEEPDVVIEAIRDVELGFVEDGTDITTAILTAAFLLSEGEEEEETSRAMILLTDGGHNIEGFAPARAAATAAGYGIRIYPVSIGEPEEPPLVAGGAFGGEAEWADLETVLTQAARISGGRYFQARDADALETVYQEIDELERPQLETAAVPLHLPLGHWLYFVAVLFLALEGILRGSRLRVEP